MKIAVLCQACNTTNMLLHSLIGQGHELLVLVEQAPSRLTQIRRKLRRRPFGEVLGQVAFMVVVPALLRKKAKRRIDDILLEYGLKDIEPSGLQKTTVSNVNAPETVHALLAFKPELVLVNGTGIIKPKLLSEVAVPFVNIHTGITPKYRGVHGGYWAIRMNDIENFGSTIHLVDVGIDTGPKLAQIFTRPVKGDNFLTYPVLQQAIALPVLKGIIGAFSIVNKFEAISTQDAPSKQWYHPTLLTYCIGMLDRNSSIRGH
jgi:methionyl-tRNA formyltransferase